MKELRDNVWRQRHLFTFDYYTDELIDFFYQTIHLKTAQTERIVISENGAIKTEL
jgi:hypothetical protein